MRTTREIIESSIELAMASGYCLTDRITLIEKDGVYWHNYHCHPLETLIIGEPITTFINYEIAKRLDVYPQWVDGFMCGYSGLSADQEYQKLKWDDPLSSKFYDGYCEGQRLKTIVQQMDMQI